MISSITVEKENNLTMHTGTKWHIAWNISSYFFYRFFALIIQCILFHALYAQSSGGQPLIDFLSYELSKAKADTDKIIILYNLARVFAPNDSAASLHYANQCMNISKQIKWQKGIGLSFIAYARPYYELSNFITSLQNSQKAYEIFKSLNDKENMAVALKINGINYEGLGNYTKCLETSLAALRLYEDLNNKAGIRASYNSIGVIYYDLSDFAKALENYDKSLIMAKELNDQQAIASGLGNIAAVYVAEGKYDSAANYSLQAIKIFAQIDYQPGLAMQYCNHGDITLALHNARAAYEYYNRAIIINKKLGISRELAADYGSIGELYFTLAKETTTKYVLSPELRSDRRSLLKKAQYYFSRAVALGKNVGDIPFIMHFANLASETEESLGNYRTALAFHKEFMLYKDSIFNDVNKEKNCRS